MRSAKSGDAEKSQKKAGLAIQGRIGKRCRTFPGEAVMEGNSRHRGRGAESGGKFRISVGWDFECSEAESV